MVSTRSIYLNIYTVPSLGQWLIDLGWDLWFLILGKSWPHSSDPFLSVNSQNRSLATNLSLADWVSNSQNKNAQILRDNNFTPPNKPHAKLMEAYLPENYHINSKVVGKINSCSMWNLTRFTFWTENFPTKTCGVRTTPMRPVSAKWGQEQFFPFPNSESLVLKIYARQVLKTTGNSKYYSLLAYNSVTFGYINMKHKIETYHRWDSSIQPSRSASQNHNSWSLLCT